ncbi:MAG: PAS domain S-box protein [Methanocella sp.]
MDAKRKELSTITAALNESRRDMTILEISKAVGMNRHSVAKYLEVLVAAGQVDMRAFGRSKIYSVSQRVPISAMLSYSTDLIITLDKDLRARYVNEPFLEITGLRREDVFMKNLQNYALSLQTNPPLMPYVTAALGGNEGSVDVFYPGMTKGYHFILKSMPTVFEDGETGATLIMSDITARVEAEEALRKERGELEVRVKERTADLEAEAARRISYESALKASEEKYRNLVENINDTIWEVDAEGRFTYLSPSVVHMLGYEPREMIGKTMDQFLKPSARQATMAQITETLAEPQSLKMKEANYLHKDGHEVAVEVNGTPLFDEAGRFLGYRGVTRDITVRKRAEEALRLAEEKYRNLVENINDVAWEIDAEGRFTYISPKIRDMLGYEPSEFIGNTIVAFLSPAHEKVITDQLGRLFNEPAPYSLQETYVLHKDGHEVTVEANAVVVYGGQGDFRGYRGIIRDITARKQVEEALRIAKEKLRNTIENVNDIVWEMDRAAKFTYVSPKVRDILGNGPEYYLGKVITEFMPQEDVPRFLEGFGRIFANPRPYSLEHMRMFHCDGSIRSVEVNGSPLYDEKGQFCGFQGVTRDITKRKTN